MMAKTTYRSGAALGRQTLTTVRVRPGPVCEAVLRLAPGVEPTAGKPVPMHACLLDACGNLAGGAEQVAIATAEGALRDSWVRVATWAVWAHAAGRTWRRLRRWIARVR